MTIALGILAPDGVVKAADTQESWGYFGGAKISGYKILTRVGNGRACSATGAGSAGYLDSLSQELTDNFLDVPDPTNVERRLREKVREFYADHIRPMHGLPPIEQPSADVILGMTWKDHKAVLLANERSALRRCKHYVAVGAGRTHASMLLSRLLPPKADTTTELALFLAAYVIFHVQSYVEGCGMGTHVTVLKDGAASYLSEVSISALETQFENYMTLSDALAVNYISGRPLNDEEAGAQVLHRRLRGTRHNVQELNDSSAVHEVAKPDLGWANAKSAPSITSGLIPVIDEKPVVPPPVASRKQKKSASQRVHRGSTRGL